MQDAHVARQRAGNFVRARAAQRRAVVLHADRVRQRLQRAGHAHLAQEQQHHADGVATSFGIRAVSGNALCRHPHAVRGHLCRVGKPCLFGICRHLVGNLLPARDERLGFAGDDIHALTRPQLLDLQTVLREFAREEAVNHALFGVDDREGSVRGEADFRHFRVRAVIRHVFPAGFLVTAKNQADGLLQRNARCLDGVHRVQRRQRRPLVVARAARENLVAHARRGERQGRPVVARRNDVEVSQHGDGFFRFARQGDIARIAVEITGFIAERLCVRHGHIQHPAHILAKRRTGRGFALHRRHFYPAAQLSGIVLRVRIQISKYFFVHGKIPPCAEIMGSRMIFRGCRRKFLLDGR